MNSTEVTSGSVKWFNRKTGFGFITPQDGSDDVFVHYSGIVVSDDQAKYLMEGEYVEYKVEPVSDSDARLRAVSVKGMNGGNLVCETRRAPRPGNVNDSDRRRRRRPQSRRTGCPIGVDHGWSVAKESDNLEDKIFKDKNGDLWQLTKCSEDVVAPA